jgi:tRNA nucleotidyltransferase (CCA-adding enzyme)
MLLNKALTDALPVLQLLEQHGYEAVFVGGCVRDTVMERTLKDVDIATSAPPDQVVTVFPHTIPTGLKHGTVTVIHEGRTYEVTTYRTESAYENFRRPVKVEFVSDLESDLLRRDFTINAMAMRADGSIIDPFGGQKDLSRGILRCVGDAEARFQEDALRMVRAVRFAAEFRMRIGIGTWRALRRHQKLLAYVAMERIGSEFDKMISGANPPRAAAWMAASGLLQHTKQPLPDALVHAAVRKRQKAACRRPDVPGFASIADLHDTDERWAALCLAIGLTEEEAGEWFDIIRFASVRSNRLQSVIRVHNHMVKAIIGSLIRGIAEDEQLHRDWINVILQEGKPSSASWLRIMHAVPILLDHSAMEKEYEPVAGQLAGLLNKLSDELLSVQAASLKELAISGSDVLRLLRKPSGPWLGEFLYDILREVAFGHLPNDRERLMQIVSDRRE